MNLRQRIERIGKELAARRCPPHEETAMDRLCAALQRSIDEGDTQHLVDGVVAYAEEVGTTPEIVVNGLEHLLSLAPARGGEPGPQ